MYQKDYSLKIETTLTVKDTLETAKRYVLTLVQQEQEQEQETETA
jgi:hypothetical protein